MKAYESLLENFSSMQEEFSSSNNRIMRVVDQIFDSSFSDLFSSLEYFNDDYSLAKIDKISEAFNSLKEKLIEVKTIHISKYQSKFDKEVNSLKQNMYSFFKDKLNKGDGVKRKMSGDIKDSVDKLCDFDVLGLEEEIDDTIYNFKVDFEMKFIDNEYCKDDFNKIIRSFKHGLMESIRDSLVSSIGEKQDIVSRYASSSYEIIDHYRDFKRKVI